MELIDRLLLIGLIAAVIFAPSIRGELSTATSTPQGLLSNIDRNTAGINSDTDGISNLLTGQTFKDENFAQESTSVTTKKTRRI